MASDNLLVASQQIENSRESDVGQDHQERGFHHSRGGGAADSIGAAAHTKTFQTAHLHDDGGEGQAFEQSGHDISQHDRVGHVMQIHAKSHLRADPHEKAAGKDPAIVAQNRQARKRDQHGQILGREQEFDRIKSHRS
jgi:hypothetical protein